MRACASPFKMEAERCQPGAGVSKRKNLNLLGNRNGAIPAQLLWNEHGTNEGFLRSCAADDEIAAAFDDLRDFPI